MKKVKRTLTKRLLAMLLCVVMVAAMLPTVISAETDADGNRTVDPSTVAGWENIFKEKQDTEYAGAVWTDKSVFLNADDINATNAKGETVSIDEDSDNFLVALSALASTKEVKGYSTIPTDTVLVLDLSQSMDNSDSVPSMINAANDAIRELLELNNYNRVGVVVYSGNPETNPSNADTAQVLLPLGRYTTGSSGNYLSYTRTEGYWKGQGKDRTWVYPDTTVSVASGLKEESTGKTVTSSSKNTIGGTYMQNGLYQAWKQFEAVEDTAIETGNIQGGTTRIPIVVLMTDGAPTTANSAYAGTYGNREDQTLTPASLGTSNAGSGQSPTNELGFLTQLTAAWVRAKVEEKYGREAKFYTLGLNLSSQDSDAAGIAAAVLNPSTSNNTIRGYWSTVTTLASNAKLTLTVPGTSYTQDKNGNWYIPNKTVTVTGNEYLTDADQMLYVDRYFTAANSSALSTAFQSIVDEIILQSKYYPTLVTSGEHDVDGYITFEDELGEYMEVKQIEGLVIGDQLFTGSALIDKMIAGDFGSASEWTELGQELLDSIAERLDVSYDVASQLASLAWRDGQLGKDAAGNYSNYIGWYGDENNEYLGFWDTDHTELDVLDGAVYINRCYGFYGQESSVPSGDMMHIVVQLRTEIKTGHQTITWKIPANLIPMVTYSVELEGDSYANAKNITMEIGETDPIQLLFEVGLRDEVNELTVSQIAENATHIHKNADGTYSFYTNRWGDTDGDNITDIDYTDPTTHLVTVSHYTPSVENERYYYTENAIIYNADGTQYTGSAKPSGTGYQHIRKLFALTGNGDAAQITDKYMPIDSGILEQYATYDEEGFWYIPKGAVYKEITRFREQKDENNTGTLDYSDYPLVYHPATSTANDDYEIYNFLGNNGKLTLTPATGIVLSKAVDAVAPGTQTDNFAFEIALTGVNNGTEYDYTWVKADGTTTTGKFTVTDGKITVTGVANGDTVYITGMAAGVTYTITELAHDDYTVSSANGSTADKFVQGTTVDKTLNEANFVNTLKVSGSLIISKTVEHPLGTGYVIPDNISFTAQVTLKDEDGNAYANKTVTTSVGDMTTDANGVVEITLKHGESVSITDLPAGTTYEVVETGIPDGFTQTADGLSGTIQSDTTSSVGLVNKYEPDPADPADPLVVTAITGTKTLTGRDNNSWLDTDSFDFKLEYWNGTEWSQVGNVSTATAEDKNFDLSGAFKSLDKDIFDAVGTYSFRVSEVKGTDDFIIYDSTTRSFDVVITDTDMDGTLEIGNVIAHNPTTVTKTETTEGTTFAVSMGFENKYVVSGFASVEIPVSKSVSTDSGVNYPLVDFEFGLYEVTAEQTVSQTPFTTVVTDADGKAVFELAYTASELGENNESAVKTYILKEVVPTDKAANLTYSQAQYEVVVTIGHNDAGSVTAAYTMTQVATDKGEAASGDVTTAAFVNTYDPTDATLTISGTKTVVNTDKDGKTSAELLAEYYDGFSFVIYETGNNFALTDISQPLDTAFCNADGTFSFKELTYGDIDTHYYVVKEVMGDRSEIGYDNAIFHVTVSVAEDAENGTLKATALIDEYGSDNNTGIEFENTYTPAATSVTLGGTKTLDGRTQRHGEFTFELSGDELTETKTAVNAANTGKFQFESITYTKAGTYTYTIKEVVPAEKLGGVEYNVDNCEYTVTVTVADSGDGELYIDSVAYSGGTSTTEAAFRNTYTAKPVDVTIKATKTLSGRDLKDGEFEFGMYPADQYFTIDKDAELVWKASNVGNDVTLAKTFDSTDVYYYVLKEISDDPLAGVAYDSTQYNVVITVFDKEDGQLYSTVNYVVAGETVHNVDVAFANSYDAADASVTLSGKKTLENRELKDGEFTFVLQELDKDGQKLGDPISVTNSSDGTFSFYKEYDAAGTYYYELSESAEDPELDVAYDGMVYQITVTVTDDDLEGKLTAAVTTEQGVAENALNFTNTYDPTLTPKSGTAEVTVKKTVKSTYGAEVGLNDFQFSLQLVDDKGAAVGKAVTVKTDEKGDAKFALTYSEQDIGKTYTYTLTEVDTKVKDMVYSTDTYTVTVAVSLGEDGKTVVTATTVTKDGKAVQAASFENVYNGQKPANNSPATGEDVQILYIVLVMLVSAAAIVALVLFRRRSSRN